MIDIDKLLSNARVLVFPEYRYSDTSLEHDEFINSHKNIRLELPHPIFRYYNMPKNEHHFTSKHMYYEVMPKIAELLEFEYNPDDFDLIPVYKNVDGYWWDLSYFVPKQETFVDVHTMSLKLLEDKKLLGYDYNKRYLYNDIVSVEEVFNSDVMRLVSNIDTFYHKQFLFSHQPVKIVNEKAKTNRCLLISHDSHMTCMIPLLSNYFRTVISLDNRNKISYRRIWKSENVTDVLVAMLPHKTAFPLDKYLKNNFM